MKALAAIMATDIGPFHLIFGGGTALGRAHRLIYRMSEDIDLKIVGERDPNRSELREIRDLLTQALLEAGFMFDPENREHRNSANASRYTVYNIPYDPINRGDGVLRPEIKVETAVWPLRQPAIRLPVSSFVAEAYQNPPELMDVPCVTIAQTAAEKFVALTRRAAAETTLPVSERDRTLLRHVYDLHAIQGHCEFAEIAAMARDIMDHDAKEFGNQEPAYREDCVGETMRALDALSSDPSYASQYAKFSRDMVFGDAAEYGVAVDTLREIANKLPA